MPREECGKVLAAYRRVYDSRHLQADCVGGVLISLPVGGSTTEVCDA